MLLRNCVSHAAIHRLLHVSRKSIEDMDKRFQLWERWVKNRENDITFGQGEEWQDVEADEATFDKKIMDGQLRWEQWCGIVQRGKPHTLVLHRLKPVVSKLRTPGPGAIRKVEWQPLALNWLQNCHIVLHTGPAKSYAAKVKTLVLASRAPASRTIPDRSDRLAWRAV